MSMDESAVLYRGICPSCDQQRKRLVVHHRNGNQSDNRSANRAIMCDSCHQRLHHETGLSASGHVMPGHVIRVGPDVHKALLKLKRKMGVQSYSKVLRRVLAERNGGKADA